MKNTIKFTQINDNAAILVSWSALFNSRFPLHQHPFSRSAVNGLSLCVFIAGNLKDMAMHCTIVLQSFLYNPIQVYSLFVTCKLSLSFCCSNLAYYHYLCCAYTLEFSMVSGSDKGERTQMQNGRSNVRFYWLIATLQHEW